MKNYIFFFTLIFAVCLINTSCVRKTYRAEVTVRTEPDTIIGQPTEYMIGFEFYNLGAIKAFTDEAAYRYAYMFFARRLLESAYIDSNNKIRSVEKVELFNEEGINIIPTIDFPGREKKEREWWEQTLENMKQKFRLEDLKFAPEQPRIR